MSEARRLMVGLCVLLLPTVPAMAGKKLKRAEAVALVSKAHEAWSLADEGTPPFKFSGPLHVQVAGKKPMRGEHRFAWASPTLWRTELRLPGVEYVVVSNEEGLWWSREPDRYLQLVAEIQDALDPVALLTPESYEGITAGKRVRLKGQELLFVRTTARGDSPAPIWKFYFDPESERLALVDSHVSYTSYGYTGEVAIGDTARPAKIEVLYSGDPVATFTVEQLDIDVVLPPALFERPENSIGARSQDVPSCEDFKPPKLIRSPRVFVPGDVSLAGGRGEIQLRHTISPEGKVENLLAVWASHPSFVEPTLSSFSDWRFRPARCGESKVEVSASYVIYAAP